MNTNTIMWNVDTQFDFMDANGKLYVKGAETIKQNLAQLVKLAKEKNITVVNTQDWHFENSKELSNTPDFINTFPQHCMAFTNGADFIEETKPTGKTLITSWENNHFFPENLSEFKNIIVKKDAFDVFIGNMNTTSLVKSLNPKNVIVFGVATNVCVDAAVCGLKKYVENVYVVIDAIKELPNIPLDSLVRNWINIGIKFAALDTSSLNNNPVFDLIDDKSSVVPVSSLV